MLWEALSKSYFLVHRLIINEQEVDMYLAGCFLDIQKCHLQLAIFFTQRLFSVVLEVSEALVLFSEASLKERLRLGNYQNGCIIQHHW